MHGGEGDCCVVVIGAGAGGALTASHLVTGSPRASGSSSSTPPLVTGRGTAYSTADDRHLLNVPASGMSAFPRDPEHFYRWVRQHHDPQAQPQDFVPRRVYGDYIEGLLRTAAEYPANARLVRRQASVVGVDRRGDRLVVRLDDGTTNGATIVARAVVLATGAKAGTDWAPDELAASGRLLDPWTDELPDGDLLLVGTGLTMVDVAIAADRPGRTLHSVVPPRRRAGPPRAADDAARAAAARHHPAAHPRRPPRRPWSRTSSGPWPRPATGAPPSTGCVPSPPSSGVGCPTTTGVPSSPTTPGPGTRAATGCLPSRPSVSRPSTTRAAGPATPARSRRRARPTTASPSRSATAPS